jgi:hypothetical protein
MPATKKTTVPQLGGILLALIHIVRRLAGYTENAATISIAKSCSEVFGERA